MVSLKAEKGFYKKVLMIAIPIMVQNGITNFVNMLDNIMVGRVGTDPMSGVAIVNELLFIWYLALFGGLSGIGIFTAQFYGKKDQKGIRYTFRLMWILILFLAAVGIVVFLAVDTPLISLFLHEDGGSGNIAATLQYAEKYLGVMLIGLAPLGITQIYSVTLKSCGETVAPMTASIIAVAVNLIGNYILIFGKFGAPALGVVGAAIATVVSRFVEMIILIVHVHRHAEKYPFIRDVYANMHVPRSLAMDCIRKGTPLLFNETLWACGMAFLTQSYSLRGLSVVAAFNISQTITNVFAVVFINMGSAIGIIIGQELGTGRTDRVREDANRLIVFAVLICLVTAAAQFAVSGAFPKIYNTSADIRHIATGLIQINALCMPLFSFSNASYFVLRSGGKTMITLFFDSLYTFIFPLPLAFILSRFTGLPILYLYLLVQLTEIVKCTIGGILVKKGIWINDITNYEA